MQYLTRAGKLLSVFFVLSFTLLLGACQTEQAEPEVSEDDTAVLEQENAANQGLDNEAGVSVNELEGDPAEYVGQTVRVDGEISDVYGQNAFKIEGGLFSGEILVIVPPNVASAGMMWEDDADVTVTGTVENYVKVDIEGEYGLSLDDEIEYEEMEPVIIAQNITPGEIGEEGDMDEDM